MGLCLTRRQGEEIVLRHRSSGEEIRVVLVKDGKNVRLLIDANPAAWNIARGELIPKGSK